MVLPHELKKKIFYTIFPPARRNQGFPSYYNRCTPGEFRTLAHENNLGVCEGKYYYVSSYFSFFFPLYAAWRLWIIFFHLVKGTQAAETFSMALVKYPKANSD